MFVYKDTDTGELVVKLMVYEYKVTDTTTPTQEELDAAKAAPTKATIPLVIPIELKNLLQEKADEAKQPVSAFARKIVADFLNFELTITSRGARHKYANADEAKAAIKKANAERNDLVKALLAKYKSGSIKLD